jgi:ketosteroid isomerase-like protein
MKKITFYPASYLALVFKHIRCLTMILLILVASFNAQSQNKSLTTKYSTTTNDAKQALMAIFDFSNTEDMTDSLNFNQFKAFFADDFVFLPDSGAVLTRGQEDLESYRGLFKESKSNVNLQIDRMDQSGELAYFLVHYNEIFTNIKTGKLLWNNKHSAIFVLKRDADHRWKIAVWRWT